MRKGEDYIGLTVSFLCHDGAGNVFFVETQRELPR